MTITTSTIKATTTYCRSDASGPWHFFLTPSQPQKQYLTTTLTTVLGKIDATPKQKQQQQHQH